MRQKPLAESKTMSRTIARKLGTNAQARLATRIECTTGNACLLPLSSPDDTENRSGAECM